MTELRPLKDVSACASSYLGLRSRGGKAAELFGAYGDKVSAELAFIGEFILL